MSMIIINMIGVQCMRGCCYNLGLLLNHLLQLLVNTVFDRIIAGAWVVYKQLQSKLQATTDPVDSKLS